MVVLQCIFVVLNSKTWMRSGHMDSESIGRRLTSLPIITHRHNQAKVGMGLIFYYCNALINLGGFILTYHQGRYHKVANATVRSAGKLETESINHSHSNGKLWQ